MKPLLYIRADGNTKIGLGHVIRCIALADMLKVNFKINFVSKELPVTIKTDLVNKEFEVIEIKNEDSFFDLLEEESIAVIDGYDFDEAYQQNIINKKAKLVCIDDIHDKRLLADLVINHAPGIHAGDYNTPAHTQFALGIDYALLRKDFLEQAKKERVINKVETVFICFGGSDANNFTESTLKKVLEFNEFKKTNVVTGAGYLHLENLLKVVKEDARINHYKEIDSGQMLSLMVESELAIVPSSGILLEALSAGCKIISGMTADNQKYVYSNYLKAGCFIDGKNFDDDAISSAIKSALNNPKVDGKKVDGNSGKRLLKLFAQLSFENKVKLAKAELADLEATYQWASNPVVRAHSFNSNVISREEHTAWFTNRIKDKSCLYLIAESDNKKIGSIRFDIKGDDAVISYLIDPEFHGKGLGLTILKKGIKYLEEEYAKKNFFFKKIIGYVIEENIPSVKAFERLGFRRIKEEDRLKFEKFI